MKNLEYDFITNIVLLGDSAVGKTSLINTLLGKQFEEPQPTINIVYNKMDFINIQNKKGKITLQDTAGQEKFRSLSNSLYREAHGVLFVYEVTSLKSFKDIEDFWVQEVENRCKPDIPKCLIGNKIDLENREVTPEEGQLLASKNQMFFYETSAKDGVGIKGAISELVNYITQNDEVTTSRQEQQQAFQLTENQMPEEAKNRKRCC